MIDITFHVTYDVTLSIMFHVTRVTYVYIPGKMKTLTATPL